MKRSGLLNPELEQVVTGLGHTEVLVVCDAGFPIPDGVRRIDLTVVPNLPRFQDVLRAITDELVVEKAVMAEETARVSPAVRDAAVSMLGGVPFEYVPHVDFKARAASAKAVVRTADFTPYSNIILVAGVPY